MTNHDIKDIGCRLARQENRNDQMWAFIAENIDRINRINELGPSDDDDVFIRKIFGAVLHTHHLVQCKLCLGEA